MAALRPDQDDQPQRWPDTWPTWVWVVLIIVELTIMAVASQR